jgi:hypothetical protein
MPKTSRTNTSTGASANAASSSIAAGDDEQLTPEATLCASADALYRSGNECCRQRRRYASLVDHEVSEAEQLAALEVATCCDQQLTRMADSYEQAAAQAAGRRDDPWWHRANALWHAAREYTRRHDCCDEASTRFGKHSSTKLGQLALQYDLEASALLALQQALDGYRKVRPESELNGAVPRPRI